MDMLENQPAKRHTPLLESDRWFVSPIVPDSHRMNLFAPPRCFDPKYPELIDRPGIGQAMLREELQILESANKRFGGHRLVLHYVQRLAVSKQITSLSVVDLGTGLADVPRAIVNWARTRQLPVAVSAVDGNPDVLRLAQESCRDWPEIHLEQHDMRALPYAANSFDLVLCSLALHHFGATDAAAILRRIQEVARLGYIVNDLRRNWLAIWMTELLSLTVIRSRILRHDAPQSCRAAFTVHELRTMAQHAEMKKFQIHRHHGMYRMVLEGRK
jgi:SAM-dependent methyltransferase